MDEQVLAAMARWPEVPDVYGWLSLTFQGKWRIHPDGRGNQAAAGRDGTFASGEPISNEQILDFINRNYTRDESGRWYFQNGPQRVFVRLDAAPFILYTRGAGQNVTLLTHNEQPVTSIRAWTLDDIGRLFATTEHGPGLIASRDLATVLGGLKSAGQPLEDLLEHAMQHGHDLLSFHKRTTDAKGDDTSPWWSSIDFEALPKSAPAFFDYCSAAEIPARLDFVANPGPSPASTDNPARP